MPFIKRWEARADNFESISNNTESEYLKNDYNSRSDAVRILLADLKRELRIKD
jgi:hypothetical protein